MSLGVVLAPYGHTPGFPPSAITISRKGSATWQEPFDPRFYSRDEAGYYYDTHLGALGAIPTDFEIAKQYGYLPVYEGWVTTKQGYQSNGWQPKYGRYPGYPPTMAPSMAPLNGLGDVGPISTPAQVTVDDLLAVQQAQNDRVFALTAVSTVAVTVSALIGLFRTIKLIKERK